MSWKHIKTVLILLFLIINAYLIYTSPSSDFAGVPTTVIDSGTVSKTAQIIKDNYGITIAAEIIPKKLANIKNINATNIIYTDKFEKSGYSFETQSGMFTAELETPTYSYNEKNAGIEMKEFMRRLGIDESSYTVDISKSDEGLVCTASQRLSQYPVFNGRIKATFTPSLMEIKGRWYIPESNETQSEDSSVKMTAITSVLVNAAEKITTDMSGSEIVDIRYGYFVSYYDENTVSKSASAIPCYMIESDAGYKYYYDAMNGKTLKQEE